MKNKLLITSKNMNSNYSLMRKYFSLLIFLFICVTSTFSQTTTLTATGHPRIFLSPAKVTQLKALYLNIQNGTRGQVPLNGSLFPVTGSMSFELFLDTASLHSLQTLGLFDAFDGTRNHIFMRLPYPGKFDSIQLALNKNNGTYAGTQSFRIKTNMWNKITLGWNTTIDSVYFKVEYYSANKWNLFRRGKFRITDPAWTPNQQNFKFKSNGYLDNVAVYSTYMPSPASYVAKFNMEKQQDSFTVLDSISQVPGTIKFYGDSLLASRTSNNKGHSLYLNYHSTPASPNPTAISELSIKSPDYQANALKLQMAAAYSYIQSTNLATFKCTSCKTETDYYRGVFNTAFMWQITGDIKFRDKAIGLIDTLLKAPRNCEALSPCGLNDQLTRGRIMTMGLLYDWMYNDIDPLRRSRLVDSIKTSIHYDYSTGTNIDFSICGGASTFTTTGFACTQNTDPSFFGGHSYNTSRSILMAVLAVIDVAPELQPLLDKISSNFKNGFDPMYQYIINQDGGHPMGYSYGTGYDIWDATYLLNQLTTDKHTITWPANSYKRFLYAARGDGFPRLGDDFLTGGISFQAYLSGVFTSYPIYASRFGGDGVAQYFNESVVAPYKQDWTAYEWFYDIVFGDTLPSPVSYTSLPLAKKFSVSGIVSCRDNWDIPNTALLNFKSSNFIGTNHVHADNNSIDLYYKAPLFIDAGYYDSYGTPHWKNYYSRTIAHNAVTVYNPLQTPLSGGAVLDGGQLTTEQLGVNYPTLAEIQPDGLRWVDGIDSLHGFDHPTSQDYTYFKGDATKAYPKSNVKQSLREIVYTRNGLGGWQHPLIFVFDKVKSANPAFVKRIHWHMINKPTKAGKRYTIINGKGKAYLDILYPILEKDTVIGGPGYNFWVNNPATGTGKNYNLACTTCDSSQAGMWRIDVKPATQDSANYFLHVIGIDDASGSQTLVTAGGNGSHPTVVYAIVNNNLLVSFSKQDTAITNLLINAIVPFTEAIISGLKPNSKYKVLKNGNTISVSLNTSGNYTASDAGVIYAKNAITTEVSAKNYVSNFNIYPNPANKEFTISNPEMINITLLTVTDVLGRVVYTAKPGDPNQIQVPTSNFENGIYILTVITENEKDMFKIMIQK